MSQPRKAVALISGGLDSLLAARTIIDQGIHVEGINFYTGFCVEGHTHAIRKHDKNKQKRNSALWVAEQLGIKLHIIDIVEEYKDIVYNPKHGYGTNLNPCLDCKVFMVGKAKEWMEENGFDFIITGEVVGQRPKSQRKETFPIIARESGADDRLLRPLCAKLQMPSLAEREGWVDREKLHDFSGRSRSPQIALAKSMGYEEWAQPAGGCCFLTDESYSNKLADLWQYRGEKRYELDDIMLLKVGRHIRPKPNFKLIISREEGEGHFMEGYKYMFMSLEPTSHLGAFALIDGVLEEGDLELAIAILGRYTKAQQGEALTVEVGGLPGGVSRLVTAPAYSAEQIKAEWQLH